MSAPYRRAWTVVLALGLISCSMFLKYGLEYHKASQASNRAKEVERTCALIESAMDSFVETHSSLPPTLKELDIKTTPIAIEQFGYFVTTNQCVISFHDSTGFSL